MPFLSLCALLFFAGVGVLSLVLVVLVVGGLFYLEWKERRDWLRADRLVSEMKAKHPPAQVQPTPGPLRFVPPVPAEHTIRHTRAINDVIAERERQIDVEGWGPDRDDVVHSHGQLAQAAACYALDDDHLALLPLSRVPQLWPWDFTWWKRKDRRRDLVRAAALLIAEIERLDRAKAAEHSPCN